MLDGVLINAIVMWWEQNTWASPMEASGIVLTSYSHNVHFLTYEERRVPAIVGAGIIKVLRDIRE